MIGGFASSNTVTVLFKQRSLDTESRRRYRQLYRELFLLLPKDFLKVIEFDWLTKKLLHEAKLFDPVPVYLRNLV